jgi:hypothetical protein
LQATKLVPVVLSVMFLGEMRYLGEAWAWLY